MKPGIHPAHGSVVFRDSASGTALPTLPQALGSARAGSTPTAMTSGRTVEREEGAPYPVVDAETSSASHPFSTGTARVMDAAGRVERFERRYGAR